MKAGRSHVKAALTRLVAAPGLNIALPGCLHPCSCVKMSAIKVWLEIVIVDVIEDLQYAAQGVATQHCDMCAICQSL